MPSQVRYAALCRNMRMYAIHLLQNYAISTRRVPTEETQINRSAGNPDPQNFTHPRSP